MPGFDDTMESAPKPSTGCESAPELAQTRGPWRILIVDDEEPVRNLLARMLKESELDCEMRTAGNGFAACAAIRESKPHLIVLDVVMPELDGAELCRVLRNSEESAGIRVLLISGYGFDDSLVQDAIASGAAGFIAKPVSQWELVAKVSALLRGGRLRRRSMR